MCLVTESVVESNRPNRRPNAFYAPSRALAWRTRRVLKLGERFGYTALRCDEIAQPPWIDLSALDHQRIDKGDLWPSAAGRSRASSSTAARSARSRTTALKLLSDARATDSGAA